METWQHRNGKPTQKHQINMEATKPFGDYNPKLFNKTS
jgi:hypothetical protein